MKKNFLKNALNNKQIKISDIEKNILKLLFFKKSTQKEVIKVSILNYKTEIKSNTVESHLTRIRNKIESIGSNVKIISSEKGMISIFL